MKYQIEYQPSQLQKDNLLENLFSSNTQKGMPKKQECWVYAYDESNKIIGGCQFLLFPQTAWVEILWVKQTQQKKGHGQQLLSYAEKEAKQRGCSAIALDTFEFQHAVPFYEKCGYQIISTVEPLNGNDTRYFLRKNL